MKIYAKQVPPEHQESPLFYGDWPENVFVFGNKWLTDHAGRLEDIRRGLEDTAEEFERLQAGEFADIVGGYSLKEILNDFLPRDEKRNYTRPERLELVKLAQNYTEYSNSSSDENKILCDVLELITGQKYDIQRSAAAVRVTGKKLFTRRNMAGNGYMILKRNISTRARNGAYLKMIQKTTKIFICIRTPGATTAYARKLQRPRTLILATWFYISLPAEAGPRNIWRYHKMKNFYIAVTVKQDKNHTVFTDQESAVYNPGYYAYIIKCTETDNLCSVLGRVGGLLQANICPTKKRAAEIVSAWNNTYKENGTHLFDTMPDGSRAPF